MRITILNLTRVACSILTRFDSRFFKSCKFNRAVDPDPYQIGTKGSRILDPALINPYPDPQLLIIHIR